MRVLGKCLMIPVLIGWLHCLKEGSISGAGCSACTMVGALMVLVIANSSLKHLLMAPPKKKKKKRFGPWVASAG
jgi:hypothetical protein